ncbi:MAG: putative DNA binding domain-containing protein [Clostridiales Family XIII bacterium]|nr:putative DNA binding domain-containing protein [Clostridiales Family XIII bacterium]
MRNIGFSESLTLEFKSDRAKLSDSEIIDAVVAFANTDGGELYLGVEDDGLITGLHGDHKDPTRLAAFVANKTVPPVSVRCEIMEFDVPVLKISVPRRTSIVATSSGKMLRRRIKSDGKPENIPLYPFEITSRLSSLSLLDYSAQPVPDAVASDLDAVERERLRNIIRSYHGEQNLLELTDEELDKALQLVVTVGGASVPTFTGLLLIGKKERLKALAPTAESAIQVLLGTDIKVNESFTLPLLAAFEKISEYMNAWNRSEDMEIGLYRITVPDIDYRSFRESMVNAYSHRDYSVLGRVRVQLNDEGLTISNPGGFIDGISIRNLPDAEPHGRNPALADALKRIGLAERTGRGIDRIFEGSLLYGKLLPDYSATSASRVSLFIPKSEPDKAFIRMLADEQQRIGRSLSIHTLLVLNSLKHFPRASLHDLADDTNIEEARVRIVLESLVKSGITEMLGGGNGGYYRLSPKAYQNTVDALACARQTGADKSRYSEAVLKLAQAQGYVSRGNAAELLHVSPPQAYRVIEYLVSNKKLRLEGKGRYAKYIPL